MDNYAKTDTVFLQLDFQNAFNLVSRDQFIQQTHLEIPEMSNFTSWCYGVANPLITSGGTHLAATTGVQQGDPLGPFLFCLVLRNLIDHLKDKFPDLKQSVWYLDDGLLVGSPELIGKVFSEIMTKGGEFGLSLNPKKCVAYSETMDNLSELDSSIIKDTNGIILLGAAIGNSQFVKEYADALVDKAISLLEKIRKLADSQLELVLTRACASAVKLNYLLRTTPTHLIWDAIGNFDDELSEQLNHIAGTTLPSDIRKLWALPITLGGFGFPECKDLGPIAYLASHNSAEPILRSIGAQVDNPWLDCVTNLSDVDLSNSKENSQKNLKVKLDAFLLERVRSSTSENRFKALLANKDGKFASRWLTAVPSSWNNHIIEHRHFQSLLRFHSGIEFSLSLGKCNICKKLDTDRHFDHAISCPAEGGTIYRHDSLANVIYLVAQSR